MFSLIILVLFGLGMAYFATENTRLVNMTVAGNLVTGIPLYVLVVGAILLGLFISWLLSLVEGISSTTIISSRDSELKDAHTEIGSLKDRMHDLELENEHLRQTHIGEQRSFWHRFTHASDKIKVFTFSPFCGIIRV